MIGLIPAAGRAERLGGVPKYLLPLPNKSYLLAALIDRMNAGGARRIVIGAGPHNANLLAAYAPSASVYTVDSSTVAETVLRGRKYMDGEAALFAMPDTWFEDDTILHRLRLHSYKCDAAVAVWKIRPEQRSRLGMCNLQGEVIAGVVDKPGPDEPSGEWAWGAIAWNAGFWKYIQPGMTTLSAALNRAIKAGAHIGAVKAEGDYWDLGTFDELTRFYAGYTHDGQRLHSSVLQGAEPAV